MPDYCHTLSIKLQAPIISQAVGAMAFGFDKAALREDAACVLPGSLIRGNLRHALQHFAELEVLDAKTAEELKKDIRRWFGPDSKEDELPADMAPSRACLYFDYYWKAQDPGGGKTPRYRIQIDEDTGAVKSGHLVVIEAPYATGQEVEFTGKIIARLHDEAEDGKLQRWLGKAAAYLPAVGALKGVGFGKLVEGKLKPWAESEQPSNTNNAQATGTFTGKTRIGLELELDRPFCIAQSHVPDGNLFTSEETIPGGVIKGALEQSLSEA
ncbi:MAG: RAMP superfamily CRISPR-associated protein, partial [Candidatus Methylumidiphilus sp.]